MARVLITGITGQDGYYLAQLAHERGHVVYGLVRGQNNPKAQRLRAEQPFVGQIEGDLLDRHSLCRAMSNALPDYIFNLGAITYIPLSWEQPELVYNTNFLGVARLLEEAEDHGVKAFVQASTSEMYGNTSWSAIERSLSENDNMQPVSPYAIAKLAAHHLCRAYSTAGRLNAISAIMFNHESPRRGETFVTRKITLAAARIREGKQETLELGNVSAVRDWGYAPEYMEALLRMAEYTPSAPSGSYVVATRTPASVLDFAERVFDLANLPRTLIKHNEEDMRTNDVRWLCGNPTRAHQELGWQATTRWQDLARIMLDADVERLGV